MKLLTIIAVLAMLAVTVQGQTNKYIIEYQPYIITNALENLPRGVYMGRIYHPIIHVVSLPTNVTLTADSIRRLAVSGDICRVKGHSWEDNYNGYYVINHCGKKVWSRTCRICGVCQSKTEGSWR